MTGVLLVDKPENITSAGVIRALKPRIAGAKVGHVGTLDPFASGLLPLCIGEATKVARFLLLERKAYTGIIRLGTATDTLDRTGQTVETAAVPALSGADLARVAARFHGHTVQRPPMYSALKRDGVPLYALARRGVEVAREARPIEIHEIALRAVDATHLALEVACSKGTYVRVLAADIGAALGTVAHLESLRRTQVGRFRVEEAAPLEDLTAAAPAGPLPLLPLHRVLADMRAHRFSAAALALLRRGQQGPLGDLPAPRGPDDTALVLDAMGEVTGVIEAGADGGWRLSRLLAPA